MATDRKTKAIFKCLSYSKHFLFGLKSEKGSQSITDREKAMTTMFLEKNAP